MNFKEKLDLVIKEIRSKLDIKNSNTRLCQESSFYLSKLCDMKNIPYIPFCMSEIGMPELEHHYGVTGFDTDNGQICLLIDLTYIQFTDEYYPVNVKGTTSYKKVLSPGNFISRENKESLIENGYIVLTEENFYDYFNSFIETYKRVNKVNSKEVFDKLNSKFSSLGVNIINDEYLNKKAKR